MKKLLISTTMLAAITSASAGFNGAQVGVSLGLGHMGADSKYIVENSSDAGNFTGNREAWGFDSDHSKVHFSGGAFAKYTHMMGESTTIGLDIFARWQNVKSKTDRDHTITGVADPAADEDRIFNHHDIRSNVAFGGGLNIGMVMGSTHAYLKLGAVASRFKSTGYWKTSSAFPAGGTILTATASVAGDARGVEQTIGDLKKTKVGFAPGLGMEYAVNENVMIALEATHEVFGKINAADTDTANPLKIKKADGTDSTAGNEDAYIVKNRSFRPRNTRIALNIGYKFM